MLSRIAESLFWIGRYVERAEDTARLLDVHLQLLVEDPTADPDEQAASLFRVMGIDAGEQGAGAQDVLATLLYDPDHPSSVVSAVSGAREAARRARETLSVEMWESINTTHNALTRGQLRRMRPPAACTFVRERAAVIAGTADNTMVHDEGWHFLILGRSIERVDMSARLVTLAATSANQATGWSNVLRSCGAHHAFLRTYGGVTSNSDAATFILLDRLFPRSLVHTLGAAEHALEELDQEERRSGHAGEASRLLGRERADLDYQDLGELMTDLPARMTQLQRACSEASAAIAAKYFEGATAALWQGGE